MCELPASQTPHSPLEEACHVLDTGPTSSGSETILRPRGALRLSSLSHWFQRRASGSGKGIDDWDANNPGWADDLPDLSEDKDDSE